MVQRNEHTLKAEIQIKPKSRKRGNGKLQALKKGRLGCLKKDYQAREMILLKEDLV
jgi:TfoX/Sxy family transcriptional regulator of competence genes